MVVVGAFPVPVELLPLWPLVVMSWERCLWLVVVEGGGSMVCLVPVAVAVMLADSLVEEESGESV